MKLTYKEFNCLEYSELLMDGIGKNTAKRIVACRPFRQDSDLFKIRGLGKKTLARYGIQKPTKYRKVTKSYLIDGEEVSSRYLARHTKTGQIDYFWRILPKDQREYL